MTRLPLVLALLPLPALAQESATDAAFAALAAPLTTGTPGMRDSSSIVRGAGCHVTYTAHMVMDGLEVDGTVDVDVSKLDPGSARADTGTPLNIRYDGEAGFYTATVTADVAQAALFEEISGQACREDPCTATVSMEHLYLTLVGDDAQERAARAIVAMKAFHASCTE